MSKQYIIRSGTVPSDSILPKFNDVFPSSVSPNKRYYVDTLDGVAGALSGRALPVFPPGAPLTWTGTTGVNITGNGSVKMANATTEGRGLLNPSVIGAQGQWSATVRAGAGAVGLIVRASVTTQESYRVMFGSSGAFGIYLYNSTGSLAGTLAEAIYPLDAGTIHTMRVVVDGATIRAYADDKVALEAVASLSSNPRVGIYFRNSEAEILEVVGGPL